MKNLPLVLLLLGIMITFSFTVLAEEDGLLKGKELFFSSRETFYSGAEELTKVLEKLQEAEAILTGLEDGDDKYYWLGMIKFFQGEIAEVMGEKRQAALAFTESGKLARQALEFNEQNSEAHHLLADTYLRLMSYNGTMYMLSKGPQALNLLKKAVSLDKNNYPALNSLASYYINAPQIGGGSPEKGIQAAQQALSSQDKHDNFISYIWLSQAYWKKGEQEKALSSIKQALEIYPHNAWALSIKKQIEVGK